MCEIHHNFYVNCPECIELLNIARAYNELLELIKN